MVRWRFGFPGKKKGPRTDEAGPSRPAEAERSRSGEAEPSRALVLARQSSVGPSAARPPRPSSVAADAIARVPVIPHQNLSSSVASANTSGRRSGVMIPTTSAEFSSAPEPVLQATEPHSSPMHLSPPEPAEPYIPLEGDDVVPAEPYVAPDDVPAHSNSFHWDYSIPVLTPEPSRGTHAAYVEDGVVEQFLGRDYLSPHHSQISDGRNQLPQEAGTAYGETVVGIPNIPDGAPAHFYNEGYYPAEQTTYHTEPVVFDSNGFCIVCACYGGHFAWCTYRHVPLPLPVGYRCPRCGQGGHLDNACPMVLQPAEPVTQPGSPAAQPFQPAVQQTPAVTREEPTRPTPPTSMDSGQQLRGSHCPLCGAHKKHWYRNLVCK